MPLYAAMKMRAGPPQPPKSHFVQSPIERRSKLYAHILAVISGEYGQRHVDNIRAHGPTDWVVEVWKAPPVLPPVIGYPMVGGILLAIGFLAFLINVVATLGLINVISLFVPEKWLKSRLDPAGA